MQLSVRHRSRFEPTIKHLINSAIHALLSRNSNVTGSTFLYGDHVARFRSKTSIHLLNLHKYSPSFIVNPNRQRCSPVAISGNCPSIAPSNHFPMRPLLDVLAPNLSRVSFEELFPKLFYFHIPAINCSIYNRTIASRAKRVIVLNDLLFKKQTFFPNSLGYIFIRVFT